MSDDLTEEELAAVLAALRARQPVGGPVVGAGRAPASGDEDRFLAWRHRRQSALDQAPRRRPFLH